MNYNIFLLIVFVSISLFLDFFYTPLTGKELTMKTRFILFVIIVIIFILLVFITP